MTESPSPGDAPARAKSSATLSQAPAVAGRWGGALAGIAIAVLAAGWTYVYYKTQGGDLGPRLRLAAALQTLAGVDARWNEEALRARSPANLREARKPAEAVADPLKVLSDDGPKVGDARLAAGAAELPAAFAAKAAKVEELRARAPVLRESRDGALAALRVVQAGAASLPPAEGLVFSPRLSAAVGALTVAAEGGGVTTLEETLDSLNRATPVSLAGPGAEFVARARRWGVEATAVQALTDQIVYATAGARAGTLGRDLQQSLDASLEERERYRTYLVSLSGSLLVLLVYAGGRLRQSYALLQVANTSLERRVAERTRDLSEALRHLKESEALLIQSEKMSSLGQMVAGVAHEINTPLAYVKSSLEQVAERVPAVAAYAREARRLVEMMQSGEASEDEIGAQFATVNALAAEQGEAHDPQELARMLGDSLHGIDQISELVLNLKNFSRLDRSKVARYDLNEGLDGTLAIARNLVKHKVIRKQYGNIPPVTCSPSQINQVFLNLVTNAAQATPDETGVIQLRTSLEGGQVRVDVEDNGHGIPAEVLPRIFDPFFTTKEVGEGTGLGLSIAYKIIEQHGGRISAASQPGKGTRFTVLLPLEPAPEKAAA